MKISLPLARVARIDAMYAELPTIQCQGKCQAACGPIAMSAVEWNRIIKRVGYEPKAHDLHSACPMLESGRCAVYGIRPMICRLYGFGQGNGVPVRVCA